MIENAEHEVPVVLAWQAILGRNGDTAVLLLGALLHREGIEFQIDVRSRTPRDDLRRAISPQRADRLLLGLEYADGRRTAEVSGSRMPSNAEGERPLLIARGNHGTNRSHVYTFVLTPTPPSGALQFWCAWPAYDIPETRTVLETPDALDDIELLWEPVPPRASAQPEPVLPHVPPEGWFAHTLDLA